MVEPVVRQGPIVSTKEESGQEHSTDLCLPYIVKCITQKRAYDFFL